MPATRPAFDPELAAVLEDLGEMLPGSVTPELIPTMRLSQVLVRLSDDDLRRGGAIEFSERRVPGPAGAPEISLLICRKTGLSGALPAVYYVHGGGMVMGNNRTGLSVMLDWIEQTGIAVVSVEYRLAPEHPHPAPVEDCYAGLVWTAEHAAELGLDAQRLLVGGASAGGGLSAAVALMARDRGGPALIGQILACPMLDDRNQTPSSYELDGEAVWDRTSNFTGWRALLGEAQGGPDVSPYAAPARATDLSGLPPAYLDVGSVETFRDEVIDYAARIWQAGGTAELHVWSGGFHGFELFAPQATLSTEAGATRLNWLRRLLSPL